MLDLQYAPVVGSRRHQAHALDHFHALRDAATHRVLPCNGTESLRQSSVLSVLRINTVLHGQYRIGLSPSAVRQSLTVQPRRGCEGDEELTAVRVRSGIGLRSISTRRGYSHSSAVYRLCVVIPSRPRQHPCASVPS
jgi:hypothetical protein